MQYEIDVVKKRNTCGVESNKEEGATLSRNQESLDEKMIRIRSEGREQSVLFQLYPRKRFGSPLAARR